MLFSDKTMKISEYNSYPSIYTFNYSDIYYFSVQTNNERTVVVFFGKNITSIKNNSTNIISSFAITLNNPENSIDFSRIISDRTPLLSSEEYHSRTIAQLNNPNISHGNINIKISKIFDYGIKINGIAFKTFYDIPYSDNFRILSLPFGKYEFSICGIDKDNRWETNQLLITLDSTNPNINIFFKNHFFSDPTIIVDR